MTDETPPSHSVPEVLPAGQPPAGASFGEPFSKIVRDSFDVVGLLALANLVIANSKAGESVNVEKLLSDTPKGGIEVFRNSAVPAIHQYNSEFLKLSAMSEDSRVSENPLYLRLSTDLANASSTVASQIRDLETVLRARTNYYVQIGVGVAASIVLGLFVLFAQKIAPTTVFYGLNDTHSATSQPIQAKH